MSAGVGRRTALMLVAAVAIAGAFAATDARAATLKLVATTPMIGDAVEVIAGENAEVDVLIGQGVDPHLFKATRADIAKLLQADAVFYNGLFLEGKLVDALDRVREDGRPVFAVAEGLPADLLLSPEGYEGSYDPHVWMDPSLWSRVVGTIGARLAELMPEDAAAITERTAAYQRVLADLDGYAETSLAKLPPQRRVLITAHDAFSYFGRRHGFAVVGIPRNSPDPEAGRARIEALVDRLVTEEIPAVFTESSVSDRAVRALVAGAAAQGHEVAVGGTLFSDSMGAPGTYEGTYQGMIDHNVTTIARALGADVPSGGLVGRLAAAHQ
jgi:manganese/zinc/iron transport system substrate-binding protein